MSIGRAGCYSVLQAAFILAACNGIYLSDRAVDLAGCINATAARMLADHRDSAQAACPVHNVRLVTAVLSPRAPAHYSLDSAVALYRNIGLPEDAIFYSGPDVPSRGRFFVGGPVYVYDGGYPDNRKYSTTNSLSQYVLIERPMARTATRFIVTLRRAQNGTVVVRNLQ